MEKYYKRQIKAEQSSLEKLKQQKKEAIKNFDQKILLQEKKIIHIKELLIKMTH